MKRTNRDLILDLLEKDMEINGFGLTTYDITEKLSMQRTNVSRILNELVKEGYAIKSQNKRPVIYQRSDLNFENVEKRVFSNVIGREGSLKRSIHLIKAAVMYPNKSLNVLINGSAGTGKNFIAGKIYEYAVSKNVLKKDCPYVIVNCLYYFDNQKRMSDNFKKSLLEAEYGYLYIDNSNLLDPDSKNILSTLLSNGYIEVDGKKRNSNTMICCSLYNGVGVDEFSEELNNLFSITINLPRLSERPLQERLDLIRNFIMEEAEKSNCNFTISHDVFVALLLYNVKNDVKQLKNDIKQGCASAYIRSLEKKMSEIELLLLDFPNNVRVGLLDYKNRKDEIENLDIDDSVVIFSSEMKFKDKNTNNSIYDWIKQKSIELENRGLSEREISSIVNVDLEAKLNSTSKTITYDVSNKNQLENIIEKSVLDIVDKFLKESSYKLNRHFSFSSYYGLCFHIQSLIQEGKSIVRMSNDQILDYIKNYKDEYVLASEFATELEERLKIDLTIDDIVVIVSFLSNIDSTNGYDKCPSILIAMHGTGVAEALGKTIQALNNVDVYYYDLPLSRKPMDAYNEIKTLVVNIPHENGILAINDAGSLKDILNMIETETGVRIRSIEIPLTTFMIDLCRKIMLHSNVEDAYETIVNSYKERSIILDRGIIKDKKEVIVTFCLSGEGGAIQIKNYIEENMKINNIEIIPIKLERQTDFITKLNKISKENEIICLIGTFNPDIFGIPFISIENVFSSDVKDIEILLEQTNVNNQNFINNIDLISQSLGSDLKSFDVIKYKKLLLNFIFNVEEKYGVKIEMNEKIGLFVHMSCFIDRLICNYEIQLNINVDEIVTKNIILFRIIKEELKTIEKELNVNIPNVELANIICIIKKSRNG